MIRGGRAKNGEKELATAIALLRTGTVHNINDVITITVIIIITNNKFLEARVENLGYFDDGITWTRMVAGGVFLI
jgi:hypothetical protein